MDKTHVTYARSTAHEKWHWVKECDEYPSSDIECMISTASVPEQYLCQKCINLDFKLVSISNKQPILLQMKITGLR